MLRAVWLTFLCVFVAACSQAASIVTLGKISALSDRGFVLTKADGTLNFEIESSSRIWHNRAPGRLVDFQVGELVVVRYKAGTTSPQIVRELADDKTANWLAEIRKKRLYGKVLRTDDRTLTVTFDDGSTFSYRATAKSKVSLRGQSVPYTALKPGQKLVLKGRTLPNMDTWLVSASDQMPTNAEDAESDSSASDSEEGTTEKPAAKPPKEPTAKSKTNRKTLSGPIVAIFADYRMFDIRADGILMHITVNESTDFRLAGKKVNWRALETGMDAEISFRRDRLGRIIALRVDLS
jgi:hypothetical protein